MHCGGCGFSKNPNLTTQKIVKAKTSLFINFFALLQSGFGSRGHLSRTSRAVLDLISRGPVQPLQLLLILPLVSGFCLQVIENFHFFSMNCHPLLTGGGTYLFWRQHTTAHAQ